MSRAVPINVPPSHVEGGAFWRTRFSLPRVSLGGWRRPRERVDSLAGVA